VDAAPGRRRGGLRRLRAGAVACARPQAPCNPARVEAKETPAARNGPEESPVSDAQRPSTGPRTTTPAERPDDAPGPFVPGPARSPAPLPVRAGERSQMVDVLRGFALLGILVPNMIYFALPVDTTGAGPYGGFPAVLAGGAPAPADVAYMETMHTFFLGKMMFIFSMLFGAGVVFFDRKGPRVTGLWYARMGWLALFGVLHAVFLWFGDILLSYALAGLALVWWARRWRPSVLLGVGGGLYLSGTAALLGLMLLLTSLGSAESAEQMPRLFTPEGQIERYRGAYLDAMLVRLAFWAQFFLIYPFSFFFGVTGMMLGGIGLARLGVLTGERSPRFYGVLAGVGLGLGLPIAAGYALACADGGWTAREAVVFQTTAQLAGIPLGLGYVGLIGVVCTAAWARAALAPVRTALGSAGRMAFTNYIAQSVICTTLFYGYGLGLFAGLGGAGLAGVVLAVWCFNLVFSVLWLRFFRFGPLEWVWRALAYMRLPRMRREPAPAWAGACPRTENP